MNLIFDGRIFSTRMTGIGTFARDVVTSILKYRHDVKLFVLCPRPVHSNYLNWVEKYQVPIVFCPVISSKLPTTLWYHLFSYKISKKKGADVYISPFTDYPLVWGSKIKHIITVHDVVNKDFKDTMEWKNRLMSALFFDLSIKRSHYIWCNSEYTHRAILQYFPTVSQKNVFVGDSSGEIFNNICLSEYDKKKILNRYGVKERFILFVGSLEPRKNLGFLIKIAPILYKKTNIQTLIIGANQWGKSHNDYDKESTIFIQHFVKTEELVELYNVASCYVSTSLNEGFGMPQLEAMKCGCPVVSPNNSGMIEVVTGYGTLVDGWDVDAWINAISSEVQREHKPYAGKKYNWEYIINSFFVFCNL